MATDVNLGKSSYKTYCRLKQGEMAALEREELVRSLEDRLAERNEGHQSLKARISELHVQVTSSVVTCDLLPPYVTIFKCHY